MASTIKGITVEVDGNVQPLNKALKDVSKTASSLNSELRVINKLLNLDPSNTTLLAQKQKVLAESIDNTSEKLKILTEAQKQAKAQLDRGEIGKDQYRELERQVIQTRNSLGDLQDEAMRLEYSMAGMGDEAEQAEKAFDEMGDAAQKSEKDMKSLSVGGVALGTVLGNIATKLLEFAGNAATFLTDAVEETKEFRSDLSKLEQNAKAAGTTFDDVADDLQYFIAITDETDSSVEALSNLLQSGFKKESLTDAVNNLSGAVIKFPDTLKIESLADSLQETLATGAATGQYGELLERLGVNLDNFNAGLKKCTTSAEKQQYAIDILAQHGLADLNEQYKESNRELIEYSSAQAKYNQTLARLGNAMQPVMTAFTNIKTTLLEGMIPAIESVGQALSEKLSSPAVQRDIQKMGEFIGDAAGKFAEFAAFVIENGEFIVKIIASIAAGFAAWKITSLIGNVINAFKSLIGVIKGVQAALTAMTSATIVGAIVAVVGVILSLVSELNKADESYQKLKDDSEELASAVRDNAANFKDQQYEMAANADVARELLGEIDSLNSKIKMMAASGQDASVEQAMLAESVGRLNAIMGDTVVTIDEQTGMINENTDAIYDNINANERQAKAQAYQEYWVELKRQELELEIQDRKNKKALEAEYNKLSDAQKKRYDQLVETGAITNTLAGLELMFNGNLKAATEANIENSEAVEQNCAEMELMRGLIQDSGYAVDKYANAADMAANSVSGLNEQEALRLIRMQENGEFLGETQAAQLEAYKANNQEQYNSLSELVKKEQELQQQRIDAASQASSLIADSQNASLEEQASTMEQNTDLTKQFIADQEFLRQQLPGMNKYIDQLTEADALSLRKAIKEWDSGGKEQIERYFAAKEAAINVNAPEYEQNIYDTEAKAMEAGAQGISDSDEITNAATEEMNSTVDAMKSIVNDEGNFVYVGRGIIQQLTIGMRQMASKLYDVADDIVSSLKSKFNFEISVSGTRKGAKLRGFATGGVVWNEEVVRVAENGPEAIIPLNRLGGIVNGILANRNSMAEGWNRTVNLTPQITINAQKLTDVEMKRATQFVSREFAKMTGGLMG